MVVRRRGEHSVRNGQDLLKILPMLINISRRPRWVFETNRRDNQYASAPQAGRAIQGEITSRNGASFLTAPRAGRGKKGRAVAICASDSPFSATNGRPIAAAASKDRRRT